MDVGEPKFLGVETSDFKSPCTSLVGNTSAIYSDISDTKDIDTSNKQVPNERYVLSIYNYMCF